MLKNDLSGLKWNSFALPLLLNLIHILSSKVKSTNFLSLLHNFSRPSGPYSVVRCDTIDCRALTLKINKNRAIDLCGASPDDWHID